MAALKLRENPLIRVLAVVVLFAAGTRLAFELLEPIWPFLAALVAVICALRVWRWHRERW